VVSRQTFSTMDSLASLLPKIEAGKLLRIRQMVLDASISVEDVMEEADKLLGTCGVEAIGSAEGALWYCNTGDTYGTTLLYDEEGERFSVGNWGSWVEAFPKRFG